MAQEYVSLNGFALVVGGMGYVRCKFGRVNLFGQCEP